MAGFYITLSKANEKRFDTVARVLRFSGESEVRHYSEFSFLWLGHDNPIRYAPAHDPVSGVRIITGGRLSWDQSEWKRAKILPFEGGEANRFILERFLKDGPSKVAPYNGAAVIVIWDPRDETVHLWTDQMGYYPCFLHKENEVSDCVITSFPDAAAADPALSLSSDLVSMAEFLRAWRVTPPHTYYREIKHAGAATYHRWHLDSGQHHRQEYWFPFTEPFYETLEEAGSELAQAVSASIHERTAAIDGCASIFISGGADSRVLLFAADDPKKLKGINLYEKPTPESTVAKALCQKIGCEYIGFGRDNDYYPRLLKDNVRWSGAMWSAEDSHYLGVNHLIKEMKADLVMTACTTDWVFKGYGLEKDYLRFLGRNLPLKTYMSERVDGFLPNRPLPAPEKFAKEIYARMSDWFGGTPQSLQSEMDRALVEDKRIRPACYTVSVSGQMMYRVFPYDTFLADSRVANCYRRIPPKWKLNGEAWGLAASRICANAGHIVDSNFGWRLDAGKATKLFVFARGWFGRRLKKAIQSDPVDPSHPPAGGSWPDLGWYAKNSKTLQDFWHNTSIEHRNRMKEVWGNDPWEIPLTEWSAKSYDLFRLLTLLAHWRR